MILYMMIDLSMISLYSHNSLMAKVTEAWIMEVPIVTEVVNHAETNNLQAFIAS